MFLVTTLLIPLIIHSTELVKRSWNTSNEIMATALIQESFEKVKYLKDRHIKKDSVNWWSNFYTNFVLKSPKTINAWSNPQENLKTYLKIQLDSEYDDEKIRKALNLDKDDWTSFNKIKIDWESYPTALDPCDWDNRYL